jgi:hypothetical protein
MFKQWKPTSSDHREIERSQIIAIDFDGVLHDARFNDWKGADIIEGEVMPGAIDFVCRCLANGYVVVIYSSRFLYEEGPVAVGKWLADQGFPVDRMQWSSGKPPARVFVDDHAFTFKGVFPNLGGGDVHELARQLKVLDQEINRLKKQASEVEDALKDAMLQTHLSDIDVDSTHVVMLQAKEPKWVPNNVFLNQLIENGRFAATDLYKQVNEHGYDIVLATKVSNV